MDKNITWHDWGPPVYIPAPSVYPLFLWILSQRDWSKGCKERLVVTGLRNWSEDGEREGKAFGIGC